MQYVLCIRNDEYPASLEKLKVYRALPDDHANGNNFIRIIDESGEDYLYPNNYFVALELPQEALAAFTSQS